MTRCKSLSALALAISLLALPPQVSAEGPSPRERARQLFVQGKKAYAAAKYAAAIKAFEAAGKIEASPILEFNVARCLDKLGKLQPALARYRAYLTARPKAANRAEVQARIKAIEAAIAKKKADPYEDLEKGGANKGAAKKGAAKKGAPKKGAAKKVRVAPVGGAVAGVAKVAGTDHGGDDVAGAAAPKSAASQPVKVGSAATLTAKRSGPAEAARPKKKIAHEATLPMAMRPPPAAAGKKSGNANSSATASGGSQNQASASASSSAPGAGAGAAAASSGKAGDKAGGKGGKDGKDAAQRPVYKQWWFWVAIGTGVVITTFIIATAASGSSNNPSSSAGALGGRAGGLTVLSF